MIHFIAYYTNNYNEEYSFKHLLLEQQAIKKRHSIIALQLDFYGNLMQMSLLNQFYFSDF